MRIMLLILTGLLLMYCGYVVGKQAGRREDNIPFLKTSNLSAWELIKRIIRRKMRGMEGRIGILSSDLVFARSGPGKDHDNTGVFRIGEVIKILNENSDWLYVQLSDGRRGWVLKQYCAEYWGDQDYPVCIILHQAMEGDLRTNLCDCSVNPKKDLIIYEKPNLNSLEINRLTPDKYYSIIDFELHTFPRYNGFTKPNGESICVLAYRGEGFYSILFDDGIIETVDMGTGKLKLRTKPELWLRLKASDSITGWLMVGDRDDWNLGPLHINLIGETDFVEEDDDWLDWNKLPYEGLLWKEIDLNLNSEK